jgi:23S rRNA (adenine2503-C2)-methyltransferase
MDQMTDQNPSPSAPGPEREILYGKTLDQLKEVARAAGQQAFVGAQLADWLYKKGAADFASMANLSKSFRAFLEEKYDVAPTLPAKESVSGDGTKKYLFPTAPGRFVEAAYIPEEDRATLCLSTQVGCRMGCLFCMTGKQGFQGQLSAAEILNQYRALPDRERITNIVYMGMGEPMDNLENVLTSLEVLTADWGYGMSPSRITVSTVGVIPSLKEFLSRSKCHLAVSLHSPYDEERRRLMPVQNVYPLKEVLAVLKDADIEKRRRVSFEYILFGGLNDDRAHARELVRLLSHLRCRVNLIRFHPIPNTPLQASDEESVLAFEQVLRDAGITATIRKSRGLDIQAACGLLSTKALVKKAEADY